MATLEYITTTLVRMECGQCGCVFAMSQMKEDRCRANGDSWFCPNGHQRHYIESENSKLKDQLAREKQRTEQVTARLQTTITYLRNGKESAERQVIGQKAAKTRLKNRIANGVCPCCTRSFSNVQRHIEHMHPEYKASEA